MPANRMNYIVLFKNESQVYGTASRDIALWTPPPDGVPIEDKLILFITYQPDNSILSVHQLPHDEVINAEIKAKPPKKKKKTEDADNGNE